MKEHHDEAVALANSLLAQSPDNQEFQLLLARTQRISAEYLFLSADLETATEQIGEATEILDRLSIEFLEVPNYRLELVETYLLVATHHPDLREAEERCGVAVTRSGQLVADYPEVPRYHEVNARALREHGRLLQRLAAEATVDSVARHQLQDRARRTFAASVTACEGLQQRFPFARQYVSELLETRIAVARMAMECADDQGARAILERAMTECEDGPVGMVPLARRAKLYRELTRMFRDLGESEFADKASRAAFRASREAMRQGIVQGISLVTSRLWSR